VDGVIVVDKPEGFTSHDVVNRMRRIAGTRKVGHFGTLDPMATGVLPLVLGRATRLAQFFSASEKSYDGTVQFGWATDTYDREGSPISEPVVPHFTRAELEQVLARFRGAILQTPPQFSAKKVAGTPAYRLARKHIAVELAPVEIKVFSLDLAEFDGTTARICVRCSAGTYLRGIAHDVGQQIGCGAFLIALRRTMSGEFAENQAFTLDALEELKRAGKLDQALIAASRVLPEIPNATVDALTAGQIRHGKDFRLSPFVDRAGSKYVKAVSPEGDLIAIGEARLPNLYRPVLVI
jgi:tRNA pseudouridine55 synthase